MSGARICLVTETHAPEINGVAMTLARLADGLRNRGHAVSVVRPRQSIDRDPGARRDPAVTLVPGLPMPGYRGLRIGLPFSGALMECWARSRPDVVYVATEGPLGWSAVRAAHRLGVPVLSGFHTDFPVYAAHYASRWLMPVVFRGLRRFHNRTRGTVVAGEPLRRRLEAAGFENVVVVGRGVDSELFAPSRRSAALRREWGAGDRDVVALSVGRLAPEKNLPLALRAYAAMRRERRTTRFVVVGDGPLRAALQRANPGVTFSGAREGEELAAHYASADVFLFPSETETFGNVTLEAMASGLAVVAYDYAAAGMHIRSGESGVLVPLADEGGYVGAAAALARASEAIAPMGLRAREHALAVDWKSAVERFENVLMAALGLQCMEEQVSDEA